MNISFSMDGNPADNAIAERVNGIIKQEWVLRRNVPVSKQESEYTIDFYNNIHQHRSNDIENAQGNRS